VGVGGVVAVGGGPAVALGVGGVVGWGGVVGGMGVAVATAGAALLLPPQPASRSGRAMRTTITKYSSTVNR